MRPIHVIASPIIIFLALLIAHANTQTQSVQFEFHLVKQLTFGNGIHVAY